MKLLKLLDDPKLSTELQREKWKLQNGRRQMSRAFTLKNWLIKRKEDEDNIDDYEQTLSTYVVLKEYLKYEDLYNMKDPGKIKLPMGGGSTLNINAKGWHLTRIDTAVSRKLFDKGRRYGVLLFSYDEMDLDGENWFNDEEEVAMLEEGMTRPKHSLTNEKRQAIVADPREVEVIAKDYGISVNCVVNNKRNGGTYHKKGQPRKLTNDNVRDIRSARMSDEAYSKQYDVCVGTVKNVRNLKSYADVRDEEV